MTAFICERTTYC